MPPCCPTVLIGLSGTTGNPHAGTQACQNMAAGRNPPPGSTDSGGNPLAANTAGQSYNNCGVETARQVISHCEKFLTNYKRPKQVEFVDEIPKTAVGKVLRRDLRKRSAG